MDKKYCFSTTNGRSGVGHDLRISRWCCKKKSDPKPDWSFKARAHFQHETIPFSGKKRNGSCFVDNFLLKRSFSLLFDFFWSWGIEFSIFQLSYFADVDLLRQPCRILAQSGKIWSKSWFFVFHQSFYSSKHEFWLCFRNKTCPRCRGNSSELMWERLNACFWYQ